MPEQRFEQAIEHVKSGNIAEARSLLEQMIKADRHNIAAWQLYAETWSNPKDKIRVWELCLRHNPMNPQAQGTLDLLKPNQNITLDTLPKAEVVAYARPIDDKVRSSQWLLWEVWAY